MASRLVCASIEDAGAQELPRTRENLVRGILEVAGAQKSLLVEKTSDASIQKLLLKSDWSAMLNTKGACWIKR